MLPTPIVSLEYSLTPRSRLPFFVFFKKCLCELLCVCFALCVFILFIFKGFPRALSRRDEAVAASSRIDEGEGGAQFRAR